MNIDDVNDPLGDITLETMWPTIFERQQELMEKYHPIERANDCCVMPADEHGPWNIDDKRVQARIKDMFWRTTEEIAEAYEMRINLRDWRARWDDEPDIRHYMEEIIDALHFMVEASIIAGFDAHNLVHDRVWETAWENVHEGTDTGALGRADYAASKTFAFNVVRGIGLAANCLKNKPWKNTHMHTDKAKFQTELASAWWHMCRLLAYVGLTHRDVYALYHKKHTVNRFRQDTNY